MILKNQQSVMPELQKLATKRQHSILITGPEGCGKTYLAKLYTRELGIEDFQVVESKISSVKDAIDNCIRLQNPLVLCIENLDNGVHGVSYAMLKFLEEPPENVFIVITCRNIRHIPDTIPSRCKVINLPHMSESDLIAYAKEKQPDKFAMVQKDEILWKCARSIRDVDSILEMTTAQIDSLHKLSSLFHSKESISGIIWKLQNVGDGTPVSIELVIRYLLFSNNDRQWFSACMKCLSALSERRISTQAILAKLAFELKYA